MVSLFGVQWLEIAWIAPATSPRCRNGLVLKSWFAKRSFQEGRSQTEFGNEEDEGETEFGNEGRWSLGTRAKTYVDAEN